MAQDYRISKFEEIDQILARVREAHEAENLAAPAPVEDRVEKSRATYLPDGPAHRVDVHRALTHNLERGPFNPERVGQSRQGAGRIVVKAEARSNDFFGAPQDPDHAAAAQQSTQAANTSADASSATSPNAELPGWVSSEKALESAVDFNEEVLIPNAKNQPTTGAVASMAQKPTAKPQPAPTRRGPSVAPPARPERTSPGFAYPEGGRYMQTYAEGFVAQKGEGAQYVDSHRTQTHIVRPQSSTEASEEAEGTAIVRRHR